MKTGKHWKKGMCLKNHPFNEKIWDFILTALSISMKNFLIIEKSVANNGHFIFLCYDQ